MNKRKMFLDLNESESVPERATWVGARREGSAAFGRYKTHK